MQPAFMNDDIPDKRPEHDPKAIREGDMVIFSDPAYRGKRRWYSAPVTKVGRVWMEVEGERLHLIKQDDGSAYSYGARWRTQEQHAHETAQDEAAEFLREQGIDVGYGKPWSHSQLELARILWPHRKTG